MGAYQGSVTEDLIIDVGLHNGEDADFYLKKGFRVLGIEAHPDLARQCRERFAAAIAAGRFILVEGAVVDPRSTGAGSIVFYANLDDSAWGTTSVSWADRNRRLRSRVSEIHVRALDFRSVLAENGIPYFMKIDIEGADRFCLEALLEFEARPEYVSIESDKVDFDQIREELGLLDRLGYLHFQAVQQQTVPRQVPPNPAREGVYVAHRFEHGASGLFGRELPGRWIERDAVLARYAGIFRMYRLFGDASVFRTTSVGHRVVDLLQRTTHRPLPGWYDTHARHQSAHA